jgi:hypothetical protein
MSFTNDQVIETLLNVYGDYTDNTNNNIMRLFNTLAGGGGDYRILTMGNIPFTSSEDDSDVQSQSLQSSSEMTKCDNIFLYEKSKCASEKGGELGECNICFDNVKEGELVVYLKNCGHLFHTHCITEWLSYKRPRCPVCRRHFYCSLTYNIESGKILDDFSSMDEFKTPVDKKDLRSNMTYDYVTDDEDCDDSGGDYFTKRYVKVIRDINGVYIKRESDKLKMSTSNDTKSESSSRPERKGNEASVPDSSEITDLLGRRINDMNEIINKDSENIDNFLIFPTNITFSDLKEPDEDYDVINDKDVDTLLNRRAELIDMVKRANAKKSNLKKQIIFELDVRLLEMNRKHISNIIKQEEKILDLVRKIR